MVSHVGYKRDNQVQLTPSDHALAGAVSGVVTRALVQPLDVLKIRFQLQVEPTTKRGGGLYHGVCQSIFKILQSEGPSALWKGHVPAQVLSITYGIAQFWSYAVLTKAASDLGMSEKPRTHGLCGGLAGMCGTLVSLPCDVVRTRFIAQGTPKRYSGVVDAWRKMVVQEGVFSLWRGLLPTLAMSAPYTALIFYFYHGFLSLLETSLGTERKVPWLSYSAVSGTAAGVVAKFCIYPLDVLKKRLQMRCFEDARKDFGKVVVYPSTWQCIVQMMQEEGMRGWFKGLWPSMLKGGASSGVIFFSYELTCSLLTMRHNKNTNDGS